MNRPYSIVWLQLGLVLLFLLMLFLSGFVMAASCVTPKPQSAMHVLQVPPNSSWSRVSPGVFGGSIQYQYDDDALWAKGNTYQSLSSGGIVTLRYPGGELADNYDWQRHAVERPEHWPREAASEKARLMRTDYKEFLTVATDLGVKELFFVVNVDGAFRATGDRKTNIRHYAQKAAAWVEAVKNSGFKVKYWEIGNEPYLKSYPLTAEEYAEALLVFSREMRAVDPSISIGAAGPGGMNWVGFGDRLGLSALEGLRRSGKSAKQHCKGLKRAACIEKLRDGEVLQESEVAWWPTLLEKTAGAFDFAIVHRYAKSKVFAKKKNQRFVLTEKLKRLKRSLEEAKGKTVPLALTEWNTPNEKRHGRMTEIEHLLEIAIQVGNNAVAGIEYAHYWPLRTPGRGHKPLLDLEGKLTQVGWLFREFNGLFAKNTEASQSMIGPGIYLLKTRSRELEGFLVVNVSEKVAQMNLAATPRQSLRLIRLQGDSEGHVVAPQVCEKENVNSNQSWFTILPQSITVVRSH